MLTNYFRVTDEQLREWCAADPTRTKDFDLDQISYEEHLDSNASKLIGWFVSPYCRNSIENESVAISVLDSAMQVEVPVPAEKLQEFVGILRDFEARGGKVDLLGKILGRYTDADEEDIRINYGPGAASVFQPEAVAKAARELARFSVEMLREQYLAEKTTTNKYFAWLGLGGEADFFDEYLAPNFERLQAFLCRAAAERQTVVVVSTD
jgi:hypothetical protein